MPLLPGKENFSNNVAEMIRAGHPRDQALAASYREMREHRARGGGIGAHEGTHLAGNIIPKTAPVPGFSASVSKIPKPEGVSPSTWSERSEAREMTRAPRSGFAEGGGLGHAQLPMMPEMAELPHMQMGGNPNSWVERREATQELSVPHGGLLNSSLGGRTDRLPLAVAADSHVIPADVVSGLGQGNTLSGGRVLAEALRVGPYGTAHPVAVHGHGPPRPPGVPGGLDNALGIAEGGRTPEHRIAHTIMAGGEFIVSPHDWTDGHHVYRGVRSIGGGDIAKGHAILRELTKRVREHTMKFLKHAPPPKR